MINTKTYILHCKKLQNRKVFIDNQIKNIFSNYEFYEDYDADELTDKIIKDYYDPSPEKQLKKFELWFEQNKGNAKPRLLNLAEISLTIKHFEVLKKIAKSSDNYAIVLEDDVIFDKNFINLYEKYMLQTPNSFDVIFMGSGASLKPKNIESNKFVYLKNHPASKCADSYIITKKAATNIVKTYSPFNICSDYELAYQMYYHNQEVYWWEPAIVIQGSETGLFKSTLR